MRSSNWSDPTSSHTRKRLCQVTVIGFLNWKSTFNSLKVFSQNLLVSYGQHTQFLHSLSWGILPQFKNLTIPGLFFLYFRLFNTGFLIKVIVNNIAVDWIRTVDLWFWKRPLYQLRHNHCPTTIVKCVLGNASIVLV